jgi:hypothetical protein
VSRVGLLGDFEQDCFLEPLDDFISRQKLIVVFSVGVASCRTVTGTKETRKRSSTGIEIHELWDRPRLVRRKAEVAFFVAEVVGVRWKEVNPPAVRAVEGFAVQTDSDPRACAPN